MDTAFTNSKQDISLSRRDETDWDSLTREEQIRSIELEGYVVIPNLLSANKVEKIRREMEKLPTRAVDYSQHQRGESDVQWSASPNAIDIIAHPPMIDFLTDLFGDEMICTSCGYGCSEPGHPGIAIHTDAQPYGSKIFGLQSSSPVLARALYYLDDHH